MHRPIKKPPIQAGAMAFACEELGSPAQRLVYQSTSLLCLMLLQHDCLHSQHPALPLCLPVSLFACLLACQLCACSPECLPASHSFDCQSPLIQHGCTLVSSPIYLVTSSLYFIYFPFPLSSHAPSPGCLSL